MVDGCYGYGTVACLESLLLLETIKKKEENKTKGKITVMFIWLHA
jgi:hypothetical protein